MFLHKFSKTSTAAARRAFLLHNAYRPLRRSFVSILPDTKEGDAIIPILNTIESPSTTAYNAILTQLAAQGRSQQAQTLYDRIFRHHDVAADMTTYSQLMLAYLNDGHYEDAMEIYYQLRDHEKHVLRLTADTYATMIHSLTSSKKKTEPKFDPSVEPVYYYSVEDSSSYIYADLDGESEPALLTALTLLNDMRTLHIQATSGMYVDLLKACAEQKDAYVLDKVHKLIRMDVYLDPSVDVFNGLMKAYQAIGDGQAVLEIWDVLETFDNQSVSIVLKTCVDLDFGSRADAIWDTLKQEQVSVENFNLYLTSLLKRNEIEEAQQLISGEGVDESSKRLVENHVQ